MYRPDSPRAYTDLDIRADSDLYEGLALEYLRNYTGTFHLLVAYQHRLQMGVGLTTPMVRATLNCMRHDAQVTNLPVPRMHLLALEAQERNANRYAKWKRPTLFLVSDRDDEAKEYSTTKQRYIELPTTWNKTFGISTFISAKRIHRVDPESHFEYDTQTKETICKLWWCCKTPWGMGKVPIELLFDIEAAAILGSWKGWDLCKSCADLWPVKVAKRS